MRRDGANPAPGIGSAAAISAGWRRDIARASSRPPRTGRGYARSICPPARKLDRCCTRATNRSWYFRGPSPGSRHHADWAGKRSRYNPGLRFRPRWFPVLEAAASVGGLNIMPSGNRARPESSSMNSAHSRSGTGSAAPSASNLVLPMSGGSAYRRWSDQIVVMANCTSLATGIYPSRGGAGTRARQPARIALTDENRFFPDRAHRR